MTNNTSLPPATADHETAPRLRTDSPYRKALLITLQNAIEGRVTLDRFQIATAYECISELECELAAANARADAERKAREEAEQIQSTLSKSHHEACVKGGEYAQRAESAERELAELAELRHDIARAVQTTSELATENAELRQHAEALALRGIENKVSHMTERNTITWEEIETIANHGVLYVFDGNERKQLAVWPLCDAALERDAIRLAILQEREGCASLADQYLRGACPASTMALHLPDAIRSRPDPCDLSAAREMMKDVERYRWIMSQAKITDFIFTYTKSTERHVNNAIDSARGEGEVCTPTMHPTVATQEHG